MAVRGVVCGVDVDMRCVYVDGVKYPTVYVVSACMSKAQQSEKRQIATTH